MNKSEALLKLLEDDPTGNGTGSVGDLGAMPNVSLGLVGIYKGQKYKVLGQDNQIYTLAGDDDQPFDVDGSDLTFGD